MKYATQELTCETLSAEEFEAAIQFLGSTPVWLESHLRGLTDSQLRLKPGPEPDAFSFAEHVHHLRDIEIEGYSQRLRRILAEESPSLPDIDGTRLAIDRVYNRQPVAPALMEFTAARRKNVVLLRQLSPEQLTREAGLEGTGRVTLARLVRMWREHDVVHRAELQELLKFVEGRSSEK